MSRFVMIIIAIASGLVGTLGVLYVGQGTAVQATYGEVLVASQNLDAGTMLTTKSMVIRKLPTGFIDPLALKKKDFRRVLGQHTGIEIAKGGYITWSSLESSIQRGFAKKIKNGKRALSINVSRSTGVSGLLKPGSKVDIVGMLTPTIEYKNIKPVTKIVVLLQNIEVLAAGRTTSSLEEAAPGLGSSTYSTITLAVTLEQAEVLIAAEVRGRLFCVLRNPEDEKYVSTPPTSLNDLLDEKRIDMLNRKPQP